MKKEIFKVGDRVYHIDHGWGEVTEANNNVVFVLFNIHNKKIMFRNLDKLSFTEYRLQGFSQERPIVLPEVGELCLVRDDDEDLWVLKRFRGYYPSLEKPFVTSPRNVYYKQIKRIEIFMKAKEMEKEEMLNFAWWLSNNLGKYSCDEIAHFEGKYLEQWKKI